MALHTNNAATHCATQLICLGIPVSVGPHGAATKSTYIAYVTFSFSIYHSILPSETLSLSKEIFRLLNARFETRCSSKANERKPLNIKF